MSCRLSLLVCLPVLSGERPFRCSICGNCFSTKGNLKVHVAGHSNGIDKFPRQASCVSVGAPSLSSSAEFPPPPPPPSLRYSSPPGGACCGHVSPQSTSSTSAAPVSPKRHCLTVEQQTSARNCPSESSDSDDKMPSIAVPVKAVDKRPMAVSHSERLAAAPPCQTPASAIPPSLPMYRAPIWLPPGIRFPPTGSLRAPCCLPTAAGTPDTEARFTSRRPSASYGAVDDQLEQFMEVNDTRPETSYVQNLASRDLDANQCAVCLRMLSCRSALLMHYRTHTGHRPFRCRLCGRAFTTKGNLKTHMGVHRAKSAFRGVHACPVCRKQFSNVVVLQQHVRLHSPGGGRQLAASHFARPSPPSSFNHLPAPPPTADAVHHAFVTPTPLLMTSSLPAYLPFTPFYPFPITTPEPFQAAVMHMQNISRDSVSNIGELVV